MSNVQKIKSATLFFLGALLIYFKASAAIALLTGVLFAWIIGNPLLAHTRKGAQKLLMISVIGLGAGMDLLVVGRAGVHGFGYTALTIAATLVIGFILGKLLKTLPDTSLLVSVGTAICGGSAIAAAAVAIKARHEEVSVSLAIVFILNALALFIFPGLGHWMGFDQIQFGLWSALAVHDTSSVIGTAMQYGPEALQVGTTVKLARALWIIPVTIGISTFRNRNQDKDAPRTPIKIPWFILGFLLVAGIVTWIPGLKMAGNQVAALSRLLLVLTLFLIGSNLSRETIKEVGLRPFLQGVILWIIVSMSTALLISTYSTRMGFEKIQVNQVLPSGIGNVGMTRTMTR